jgi:hypothetical protein
LVLKVVLLVHADVAELLNRLRNEGLVGVRLLDCMLDASFRCFVRKLAVPGGTHVLRIDGAFVLLVDAFHAVGSLIETLVRSVKACTVSIKIAVFCDLGSFSLKTSFEIHYWSDNQNIITLKF